MSKSQRDDYLLLSRDQQVLLVRLRTGRKRLNSHMHSKLELAPSPTCPCGPEDQTTEHVLQRRPLHKATKREEVWPVSVSLTTKLYGCKEELEKTTSFVSRATQSCSLRMSRRRRRKRRRQTEVAGHTSSLIQSPHAESGPASPAPGLVASRSPVFHTLA